MSLNMSRRNLARGPLRFMLMLLGVALLGGVMAPEVSAVRLQSASGAGNNRNALPRSCVTAAGQRQLACSSVPSAAAAPNFTVQKLQEIGSDYTTSELEGLVGETVYYEIIATNTGEAPIEIVGFTDPHCEEVEQSDSSTILESGGSLTWYCHHELVATGRYSNQAHVEAQAYIAPTHARATRARAAAAAVSQGSNTVYVSVPRPEFTITKLQKTTGTFTESELEGHTGEVVHYEIVVNNTGAGTLTFGPLEDSGCEGVSPSGASELKEGQEETFTCSHTLTAAGTYSNEASIEGNEGTGKETSNTVIAKVERGPASKSGPGPKESTTPTPSTTTGKIELAEPFAGAFTWSIFTVTATVTEAGAPQPGVPVSFSVTGANPHTGSVVTDAGGQATFSYVPANAGLDRIVVTFQTRSKETISSELAKTWLALPPPTLGKTINIGLVSGSVYIEVPASAKAGAATSVFAPTFGPAYAATTKHSGFVPLVEARQVPVGATLDATEGVARVITATGRSTELQSGEFGAGIFKVLQQGKQHGLTELRIVDNVSKQTCTRVANRATVARRLSSKVLGRLNASAHGKFTARGQFSAATVRGTIWSVANQCNGTLTRVTRDVVTVRDFVRHKTITLHSGQRYLAKAP